MNSGEGHRERLRKKFQSNPDLLTDTERLELLLTYAIPRRDVAPLVRELVERFGSLMAVISAPPEQLSAVIGIGESTITYLQLVNSILADAPEAERDMSPTKRNLPPPQPSLFEPDPREGNPESGAKSAQQPPLVKERRLRVFANDEVANSLTFLPQAINFQSLDAYKSFLYEKLPYNASETRIRRTRNILERCYPEGKIDIPLTYFAAKCSSKADLQPVVFYHVLKSEVIVAKIAEELIWPALPLGRVERDQVNDFVLRYISEAKPRSVAKILESLSRTYSLTNVATADKKGFRFQLHKGSLEGFLYILTSEFPRPGIYSYEALFNGPVHRWMLWDREWIRQQLYNLQDFGVLTKVSEIDAVRQFSLAVEQQEALRLFFEHPARNRMSIREPLDSQASDQES